MARPSIYADEFEYDEAPDGYRAGEAPGMKVAGGEELAVRLYELPAGQSLCPYHYEYTEEWLIVVDGEVTLRAPSGERELERGAVVCFPPGPDGAHKVTNRSQDTARVLMFSSAREPAVAVYPDSDKIGVWTPNEADKVMLRRADGNVDYWDGEA